MYTVCTCVHTLPHYMYVCTVRHYIRTYIHTYIHTIYAEIFMGEIFRGLNFHGVKMVEATHENWPLQKFCHLYSLLDGKMAAEFRKKLCIPGYLVYDDM